MNGNICSANQAMRRVAHLNNRGRGGLEMFAKLGEAVSKARAAVNSHPAYVLPLGYRQLIWSHLGPRSTPGEKPLSKPLLLRLTLARLATEKALPSWQEIWPDMDLPWRILSALDNFVTDSLSVTKAWR